MRDPAGHDEDARADRAADREVRGTDGSPPASLAFRFAAWLLFMRGDLQDARRRAGEPVPANAQSAVVGSLWSVATARHEHRDARLVASALEANLAGALV